MIGFILIEYRDRDGGYLKLFRKFFRHFYFWFLRNCIVRKQLEIRATTRQRLKGRSFYLLKKEVSFFLIKRSQRFIVLRCFHVFGECHLNGSIYAENDELMGLSYFAH